MGRLIDYFNHKYPYSDFHELNADWIISEVKELIEIMENFLHTETIKFADPITWNITTQYSKNTIVIDSEGNAYLSKEVVPAGIQLNDSLYWLEIFNFTDYTRTANQNLTVNTETNTTRATAAYQVDDWLIWNDVLYKVTSSIAIDDTLIVSPDADANLVHFTVEDFIKAFMTWATNTIQQYKNDIDASEAQYRLDLAGDIADTTASLQAQLDAAIAGATVDSEVINARVGANGITYATLGDAIRKQFLPLGYEAVDNMKVSSEGVNIFPSLPANIGNIGNTHRAATDPFSATGKAFYIKAVHLPTNCRYYVGAYSGTSYSDYVDGSEWVSNNEMLYVKPGTYPYLRITFDNTDNSTFTTDEYREIVMEITEVSPNTTTSAVDSDKGNVYFNNVKNLYHPTFNKYGKDYNFSNQPNKAISDVFSFTGDLYVCAKDLPSNLVYCVAYYAAAGDTTAENASPLWINDDKWHDVSYSGASYARIYFKTADDTNISAATLNGLNLYVTSDIPTTQDNNVDSDTENLFVYESVIYNKNDSLASDYNSAVSEVINTEGKDTYILVSKLASGISWCVAYYPDSVATSRAYRTGWNTEPDAIISADSDNPYIRICFSSNSSVTKANIYNSEISARIINSGDEYIHIMSNKTALDTISRVRSLTNKNSIKGLQNDVRLRVCTYNVGHYGMGHTSPQVAGSIAKMRDFIGDNHIDILGMQEADDIVNSENINNVLFDKIFRDQQLVSPSPWTALQSIFPILPNRGYSILETGYYNTIFPYGNIKIGDKVIWLASFHFDLDPNVRSSMHTKLLNMMGKTKSFIVFGDFNAGWNNGNYSAADAQAEFDNYINAGYNVANGGLWGLINTQHSNCAIDNIITSPDIKIVNVDVRSDLYNDMFSDHYPMIADLLI